MCKARRSSEPSDTGSVAATPSSPSSPRARRGDAKAMRAQLAMIGTLTHSSPSSVTLARALARLRQRQVQRGSRSDACTARLSSEPSDTGTVAATPSSPSSTRAQLAMIGTLTHSSPLSHTSKGDGSVATTPKARQTQCGDMRAQLGDRRCDRIPDTLISVGRNTRRGECTAAPDARAIGTLSP